MIKNNQPINSSVERPDRRRRPRRLRPGGQRPLVDVPRGRHAAAARLRPLAQGRPTHRPDALARGYLGGNRLEEAILHAARVQDDAEGRGELHVRAVQREDGLGGRARHSR